ncbi:MAG: hypothetical protein KF817_11265 [Phycisphaeraceae bacterium]|nr:hypothetical protein [Phycisphaeraceae bacterium]
MSASARSRSHGAPRVRRTLTRVQAPAPSLTGTPGCAAPDAGIPEVYRFERRRADRWSTEGVVICHETGGDGFGRRHAMEILDASEDAIGAACNRALVPGTPLTVSGLGPVPRRATVLRCLPNGRGYRLALVFAAPAAA